MDTTATLNLDLDSRLSLGFAFGIFGLTVELVGWVIGFQISSVLTGAFVTIILATFGAQIVRGVRVQQQQQSEFVSPPDPPDPPDPDDAHRNRHGYVP